MTLSTSFTASLPAWVVERDFPSTLATHDDRVALTNELAARNHREGNGGPFAAIVVDRTTGELVSVGVNVVLSTNKSSVHAEVMALSLAQEASGSWDLGASPEQYLELVVNWRPCTMCYGALVWSGVKHLVIAGDGPECEELTGFDEGPMPPDWVGELETRGISVTIGVQRDEAVAVFAEYGRSGAVVYNARGTGSRND
ncbi:nucleoside deaminase [Glaciihabitans arcticus]|uniref:Nucleoside deaminase n=1 Tax=Glaciihabitans arcticus TaxID=2668039 RepID=A0A4Q9GVH8_9MICO|nr:nucleoside deaminase [Glaciihabitans arcticus]TBN56653.1 nucleoside deaminase [Glaciihabitans arcticus]